MFDIHCYCYENSKKYFNRCLLKNQIIILIIVIRIDKNLTEDDDFKRINKEQDVYGKAYTSCSLFIV